MPHLSPILWTFLYMILWASLVLLMLTIEYFNPSLKQ